MVRWDVWYWYKILTVLLIYNIDGATVKKDESSSKNK